MRIPLELTPEQLQEAAINYAKDLGFINPEMFPDVEVEFPRNKVGKAFVTRATVTFSTNDHVDVEGEPEQQELPLEEATEVAAEVVEDAEQVHENEPADTDAMFTQA